MDSLFSEYVPWAQVTVMVTKSEREQLNWDSEPMTRETEVQSFPQADAASGARLALISVSSEDIKKRWQEYTEELYKKDLHDPDNHDGMITHLEPDILECEVKWDLEASLQTKLVEVMEFQLSYFKSWKMMLWKCRTQYASKFGKLNSGHRTEKGQFSFQSQRKAMPKNAQTTTQLHSSHMLVK